ncbi:MAG: tetratricopeptide repeat protein [Raineya sp.]|jgi:tetratricopeptide (TPR) repeat protein|nr:tetratricopeptide repeat protein [Raineya sp.]
MKIFLQVLFTSFLPFLLYSQNKKEIDSLDKLYQTTNQDTLKILVLSEKAFLYRLVNPDTSMFLAQKAFEQSEKINYEKGKAMSLNSMAAATHKLGKHLEALDIAQRAITIFEKIKDNQNITRSYNIIGDVYRTQKNYMKALEYFKKSLKIGEQKQDKRSIARAWNNIGFIYLEVNDYSSALEALEKSLAVNRQLNNRLLISYNLNNIGDVYLKKEKYKEALDYYEQSLAMKQSLGDKWAMTYTYNGMAQVYQKQKTFDKSVFYGLKGLEIAQEIKALPEIKMLHESLYHIYKDQGDYSNALKHHEKYKQSNDSLFSVEKAKSTAYLENKVELEKKEKAMAILAKNNELNKLNAEKKMRELILITIILIFIIVFFIVRPAVLTILAQNKTLKDIAFTQSHHVRRHLVNIMGAVNLLKEEKLPLDDSQKQLFNYLEDSSENLDNTIHKIVVDVNELERNNSKSFIEKFSNLFKRK